MKPRFESIQMPTGESLRLLRWSQSLAQVEALLAGGGVRLIHGEGGSWHYHREIELTWVTEGAGTRIIGDHVSHFSGAELVLIGSNLPHYWHVTGSSAGLAVQFDPMTSPYQAMPELENLRPLLERAGRGILLSGKTERHVCAVLRELPTSSGVKRLGLVLGILADIAEAPDSDAQSLSHASFPHTGRSGYQAQMEAAVRWVFERATEGRLHQKDLLREIGMTKSTFSRQFPKHSGRTLVEFVNEVRLQHARQQLVETGKSIAEIAFASEYESLSHFNRKFLASSGETPSAFRRRVSNSPPGKPTKTVTPAGTGAAAAVGD